MTTRASIALLALAFSMAGAGLVGGEEATANKKKAATADFAALKKLFLEAREQTTNAEYAAANDSLATVLSRLPDTGPYDQNRKNVYYTMAGNHAQLGENDKALEKLEAAVQEGYWNDKVLAYDANFQALRNDERYQKIVDDARLGLIKMALGNKDIHGNTLKMEDYRDKVIVFDLWGTWCGPCRREIPTLTQMQNKHGKDGLRIIGLTCERGNITEKTREKVKAFAMRNGINYTLVLLDQSQQRAVELRSVPTKIYVGKNFTTRGRESGALPAHRIEGKILPLLKEGSKTD